MAHELTKNANGEYEMFSMGEMPWHGLGQRLEARATADQALEAARLNWTASLRELITVDGINIPKVSAIIRDDNKFVLGVMSSDFRIIQNVESAALMDAIIGTGEACYETAGSIYGGKKTFMVAKLPGVIRAKGEDITEQYLTLVNAHDGTASLRIYFTPIRVVCKNTLTASLQGQTNAVAIRHYGDISKRIESAQEALGLAKRYYQDFQEIVTHLTTKQVDRAMVAQFLKDCFEVKAPVEGQPELVSTRTQNNMATVTQMFDADPKNNMDGAAGTAWGLYNAAVQYADYATVTTNKTGERRMNSVMFGTAADFKQKALANIMALTA